MMKKPAVTEVPIHPLIAERWSGRAFDETKTVTREQVLSLLEAARWAPSCYGDQPWRFVVWHRTQDPQGWEKAFATLWPFNQAWVKRASLLVLVCADPIFSYNGEPNAWAEYDCGAAAENLCLQAVALGLMAHPMAGFDAQAIRAVAGVPDRYKIVSLIAVGHPAEPDVLDGELAEKERAPRERRPLAELCFAGKWGKSL
jgi:nitroreductase